MDAQDTRQRPQSPVQQGKMMPGGQLSSNGDTAFHFFSEQVADFRILRYQVPGFNELSTQQKQLAYYLYEAALCGRDIFYDQSYQYNLIVRKTLEALLNSPKTDRKSDEFGKLQTYAKQVFFANGIHHFYSNNKMLPGFSQAWFETQVRNCPLAQLPLQSGQDVDQFITFIKPIIFDQNVAPKRTSLDTKSDLVKSSAVNFYENVSQQEVSDYYKQLNEAAGKNPPSFGLNSKLVKENGALAEKVWKVGSMYSPAIEKIVYWLGKAKDVAENEQQRKTIDLLMQFYQTGDLKKFDEYSIEWAKDTTSVVDFINGYIEVYHDPLGYKGSWEAYVSIKDPEATHRIKSIGDQAQWFEDHSPIGDEFKKRNVKGIAAKVINVVVESGDLAPLTAIGINLPNAEWIREQYGSKSVTIGNITHAYAMDLLISGVIDEFYYSDEVKNRLKKYGAVTDDLHTDMHEVIGHASGQIKPGVSSFNETLKSYANTLEEARADLVALYYMTDPKLVEIGVMPNADASKTEYDRYITNALLIQLARLPQNDDQLEEPHMRNRHMIAQWVYEKGKAQNVISKVSKDGKTYYVVNDYAKLRTLFGQLLREVQRIKSEGDYAAGSALVEQYGVKVDPAVHKEVLERNGKLNIAPYRGFIQPRLEPLKDEKGNITDVRIIYPPLFMKQMMFYGRMYSFLPLIN
jgi:dipeptidyl-peptidase-3